MPERNIRTGRCAADIDSRKAVPYNLYLAAKFNAHINVEVCSQISSIKYVYKYVYQGNDRAQVYIENRQECQDEIRNFLDARYVSAAEAIWRIMSFKIHKEYPACQRLDIHLEDERLIYFDQDDNPQQVLQRDIPESTLTACYPLS
ncbi:hypothetical protein G6F42_025551 [Rhizopus arrhizus]|nr:hypothetical protein G6F42_025551 [Rhizopus arrhizus]